MTTNGSLQRPRLRFQYNEIHICVQSGPLPPRPMSGDFFNIRHETCVAPMRTRDQSVNFSDTEDPWCNYPGMQRPSVPPQRRVPEPNAAARSRGEAPSERAAGPLQRTPFTLSRLAAASERARASGGGGLAAMGAVAAMSNAPMSTTAAVSEDAARSRDEGFRRWPSATQ